MKKEVVMHGLQDKDFVGQNPFSHASIQSYQFGTYIYIHNLSRFKVGYRAFPFNNYDEIYPA